MLDPAPLSLPLSTSLSVAAAASTARRERPAFRVPAGLFEATLQGLIAQAPEPRSALAGLQVPDLYLAAACACGDPAALAEFDARVLPGAVKATARLGVAPDFADEVAQAVRSRLFTGSPGAPRRIASYAGRATLESWTRAVALRVASSLRGTAHAERTFVDEKLAEMAAGESAERDLIHDQLRREFKHCFAEALASLPSRSRSVLRLHLVDGVTLEGLATAYGVHRATVARWLASARSSLLKRTRARLATLLRLGPGEIDSLIAQARSRLEISLAGFLASSDQPASG